jgi:hypothetical protein
MKAEAASKLSIAKGWEALRWRTKPRHIPFFFQRLFLRPSVREAISSRLAAGLPQFPQSAQADPQILKGLRKDGFAFVDSLITPTQIEEMKQWLADKPLYDRFNRTRQAFKQNAIPRGTHVASYEDADVLSCPHVLEIANDPRVLSAVGAILGCKPTISNLTVWWSVGDGGDAQGAEFFHRDVDDWRFIKLFVYLTDVTEKTGPHMFVEGSHNVPLLLAIRRYTDDQVRRAFPDARIRSYSSPAGTSFLENTFGLHKGMPVVDGRRLIFQVLYSMYPIGIYRYDPLDTLLPPGRDPYINRLYVKPRGAA